MAVKRPIKFTQNEDDPNPYLVKTETLSISEKKKILDRIGRPELIEVFEGWEPKRYINRKKSAPLDQRISITVTDSEKIRLQKEIKQLKKENFSTSGFIRNRALGSVDIHGWKNRAVNALKELKEINQNQNAMKERKKQLLLLIDECGDKEEEELYETEKFNINESLSRLIAQNTKRRNRLSGRMTMVEAETVKWRAARICISSSDYFRMLIFNLEPDTDADSHLSLDARRRFYVSIIDVAENGWGEPPSVYGCSQCSNYVEEISRLRKKNKSA